MPHVISSDGTAIAYERKGTGPALVIVDGALCSRAFGPSSAQAARLAEQFSVYTYDRRGRSESADTQPYAVEREIEDLATVIGAAGGSAFVYGISVGSVLALRAAAALGATLIPRLAMCEPPLSVGDEAKAAFARDKQHIVGLLAAGLYDEQFDPPQSARERAPSDRLSRAARSTRSRDLDGAGRYDQPGACIRGS